MRVSSENMSSRMDITK